MRMTLICKQRVRTYCHAARLAEANRAREGSAAIIIQSYARGFLIRRRLDKLRWVAGTRASSASQCKMQ